MPITNRQDASDVDQHITEIFDAGSTAERAERIRRLFVEKLDFEASFQEEVSLEETRRGVTLPMAGYRLASLETTDVVYVDLFETEIETDRVLKPEASDAARLISADRGADVLMVFTNRSCSQLHFILPSFEGRNPSLRRMVIERDLPRRTAVQQLSNIYWEWDRTGNIRSALESVFDVEAVTNEFFEEYKRVFNRAMELVTGFGEDPEAKNLFVQTLFNRLMFVYFISRKGWLEFEGENDYLDALWESYELDGDGGERFYESRLKPLFFDGLNDLARPPELVAKIGNVPFFNGGLFYESELDLREGVEVPDDAIRPMMTDVFDRFNFTVMESTEFDVEVAVDPEMLGKVFEELVTARHDSGAYYTPRPVVSFMCREALKGYLLARVGAANEATIVLFVDKYETKGIGFNAAQQIAAALDLVKVVDPACGSGAYLLGMMHELVELHKALFNVGVSNETEYELKLKIIGGNLYGADSDDFAINIAMLRLWLSLAIDYDGSVPEPLPNLDFKIVQGDSLLAPNPSTDAYGELSGHRVRDLELDRLKADFMDAHEPDDKECVRAQIEQAEDQIRAQFGETAAPIDAVDWRITFAEVFAGQKGFDVVVANPPYVRQEKIGSTKPTLRKLYPGSTNARSDLYCYFYDRALQLLRTGGVQVFVCSNSWLDVGYGAKLQEHLLKNARVDKIYESAVERQFSTAQINTIISVVSKSAAADEDTTNFVSLRDEFKEAIQDASKRRETSMSKGELMASAQIGGKGQGETKFVGDKWGAKYLRAPDIYRMVLAKGGGKLVRLGDIAIVRFGIKTGVNEFFYLSEDEINRWGVEEEFLKPAMISPQESRSLIVDSTRLRNRIFICNKNRDELSGTNALSYIEHGERNGFHRRSSVTSRRSWWDLGEVRPEKVAVNTLVSSTARTFLAPDGLLFDQSAYTINYSDDSTTKLCTTMNSTVTQLMINLGGRVNFGGGLLRMATYEVAALSVVDPVLLANVDDAIFEATDWDVLSPSSERKTIDSMVFDVLTLTSGERDGVYEGVRELVENRMRRAKSV